MTIIQMSNPDGRPDAMPGAGDAAGLKCKTMRATLTAALALNDVLTGPKLAAGSTIVDVIIAASDLDSNGAPTITLDVGYGVDPDYFIAASNIGQAGGIARASASTAKPLTLVSDDTIDVTVHAAPATGQAGTVDLTVVFLPPSA
ncbi:hypothetical protein G3N58_15125 [Paraburkholderia sp. Ac-20342]|uniref:hypothetical protein n=1 Tax=Paraburkholderia sp. Ac-20342 TaxID=2703889 RepID=UPI0019804933|nr:hypothetical protein [Paraburkholderia sp. Ac-20342]MBN3848152.1 hypothetical protein [Paraburkholderia sp. Ac-20342]